MKRLTLIRHAKSDWRDVSLSDFDRPLNGRGKKTAPMMGQRMFKRGDIPDLLLSSPAKRAAKTARLMARELAVAKEEIVYRAEIFEAKMATLVGLLGELSEPGPEHVALIGHNPALSELAEWLCADAPDWLPTCAVLTLDLDIDSWENIKQGCGQILHYDFPKKSA